MLNKNAKWPLIILKVLMMGARITYHFKGMRSAYRDRFRHFLPRSLTTDAVFPHMCAGPPLPPSISISFISTYWKQWGKFIGKSESPLDTDFYNTMSQHLERNVKIRMLIVQYPLLNSHAYFGKCDCKSKSRWKWKSQPKAVLGNRLYIVACCNSLGSGFGPWQQ